MNKIPFNQRKTRYTILINKNNKDNLIQIN